MTEGLRPACAAAGRTGKSRKEERVMEVSRRIRAYMELQGMVPMEMAAALQMGKTTFYGRLKHPANFTLGEVQIMAKKLRVSEKELLYGGGLLP